MLQAPRQDATKPGQTQGGRELFMDGWWFLPVYSSEDSCSGHAQHVDCSDFNGRGFLYYD